MTLPSTMARGGLVLALAGVLASPAAAQFNSNYQLALPLQPDGVAPPSLDGFVDATEWSGSLVYRMEDGAPLPAASMRAMHNASTIWLAFASEDNTCDQDDQAGCDLNSYPLFNQDDIIVLAFNINGTPTGYRRLHIQPCFNASGSANQCPVNGPATGLAPRLTYWTGSESGGSVTWTPASVPADIAARTASSIIPSGATPSSGSWSVELQLPRAMFALPANSFGLFVDVIPTNSALDSATQYAWPSDRQIAGPDGQSVTAQIESTPVPRTWGVARLGALAAGVNVVGFGSNGEDPTKISLTKANEFHATLANGSAAPATNLVTTFRIANWGVSGGSWALIPTSPYTPAPGLPTRSNPTPPVSLTKDEYRTVYSGIWNLTPAQQTQYRANPHQCVRVDVVGAAGVGTSRQFNMDFVEVNSPFTGVPTIALPKRNPLIKPDPFARVTLREQFLNVDPELRWSSEMGGAEPMAPGTWVLRAGPGSRTRIKSSVLVKEGLRLPSERLRLVPETATGMEIRVNPGSTLTVLASGAFRSQQGMVTPDGLEVVKRLPGEPTPLPSPLPVNRGERYPDRPGGPCRQPFPESSTRNCVRPGALVGSFDGFRTSFLIGPAATLQVPREAKSLQVRLAPDNDKPLRVKGDGFVIQLTGSATDRLASIPEVDPRLFAETGQALLPLGANLPAWIVRAEVDTGRFVRINRKVFASRLPLGSFGSFITRVGEGSPQ